MFIPDMMIIMKRYGYICLLLTMMMLLSSGCDQKELYMIDSRLVKVWVDFNFDKLKQSPASMRVLFYPIQENGFTGAPYVFDITGTGGYANVPEGDFKVLAFNVDTENILQSDESSFDMFRLTTASSEVESVIEDSENSHKKSFVRSLFGSVLPRSADEDEFMLYDVPDFTCRCYTPHFHVSPIITQVTNDYGESKKETIAKEKLTMQAETAVCTLSFDIKGIVGLVRANYVRATLSGVSCSYLMGEGRATDEAGMVAFDCRIDKDNDIVHGKVYVWGFQPHGKADSRQFLNIYVWATGGNFYFTNEITDELSKAVRQAEISKEFEFSLITDLDITQGVVGNSGFEPSVGDWEEENRDIAL